MQVSTDAGYLVREEDRGSFPTPGSITAFVIHAAVTANHELLDTSNSMIFGRIQEQLVEANGSLDLEAAEISWLLGELKASQLPPNLSMWKSRLIGLLENHGND